MSEENTETEDSGINPIFESMRQEDANNIVELVNLGALERDFEFCGNTFGLRTLRADEDFAVGAALKEWADTVKEAQVWGAAHVGMALTHINGDETFCPPTGPSKTSHAKARLRWITQEYYWPVIQYLYERYADLLDEQQKAIAAAQDF